ncbi:PAAR domain-containing protein [Paraburkholderia sp.]|uniref:PAAR domain-containing protein n=1 Tax=Paraburkholderia sp. TaxID=1926495 RepID=UPI003D6E35C5
MRKAAIRHGDPTTTGGVVIALSSTIHDGTRKVALSGDLATCRNCKGTFRIFGTGKGMSEKGRDVVIDGDRVLCPCGKNRVIVGSNPGIFLEGGGGLEGSGGVVASTQSDRQPYDEQVRVVAPGAVLEGYPYVIENAGTRIASGHLDKSGRLPRVYTDSCEDYTVHWGDEALAKQDGA